MLTTWRWCLAAAVLSLIPLSGCATMTSAVGQLPFAGPTKESPKHPVVEVLTLWQPGQGPSEKGTTTRGFAGQIMFFAHGSKTPVAITGAVRVYVFDDQGTPEEQAKPIHVFEFGEGTFQQYATKNNIGHAYQLFIPYTRPGDHRAVCSLRVKYKSTSGREVLSDPSSIILAGRTATTPNAAPFVTDIKAPERERAEPLHLQPRTMTSTQQRSAEFEAVLRQSLPARELLPAVDAANGPRIADAEQTDRRSAAEFGRHHPLLAQAPPERQQDYGIQLTGGVELTPEGGSAEAPNHPLGADRNAPPLLRPASGHPLQSPQRLVPATR